MQLKLWSKILILVLAALSAVVLGYAIGNYPPILVAAPVIGAAVAVSIFFSPWLGIALLVFFLPFERIGSIDIGGTTVRPSQLVALATIPAIIRYALKNKDYQLPKYPIIYPLIAFLVVTAFGLWNSLNLERSIMVFSFIVFTMSISWLVPAIINTPERVKQLLPFLYVSFGLVTLFGLFQFFGDIIGLPQSITGLRDLYTKDVLGFPRIQSTALEPLYFANYMMVPLAVLLSLFLSRSKVIPQKYVVGLLGLGLVNLVLTVARGAYIAFVPVVGILLLYYFKELLTWRIFFYAVGVLILGVAVLSQVVELDVVINEFAGHVINLFEGASFNERVEMYQLAYRAWLEHPFIGIGPGSFGPYVAEHPYIVPGHGWNIVNNEYLELLAEHGLFGLLSILTVFGLVLLRSVKAMIVSTNVLLKTLLVGVMAGFVGILVQYNTFSILYIVHVWFTIGLLIALQNVVFSEHERTHS